METIRINGLDNFFQHMNNQYGDKRWALVGGCAAWIHITAGIDVESDPFFEKIFPNDIELVCTTDAPQNIEVTETFMNTVHTLSVDFVAASISDNTASVTAQAQYAEQVGLAKVIPKIDIINKYNISSTGKAGRRRARVYMLEQLVNNKPIDIQEAELRFNQAEEHGFNPFAGVKLKKVSGN